MRSVAYQKHPPSLDRHAPLIAGFCCYLKQEFKSYSSNLVFSLARGIYILAGLHFLIAGELRKELLLDVFQLSLQLFSNLVLVRFSRL